jgi:hypothetical protein
MHSDPKFGPGGRGGGQLYRCQENGSGLCPSEKELSGWHSGAFSHKNTPGYNLIPGRGCHRSPSACKLFQGSRYRICKH